MVKYTLVLVRHGESAWNKENRFCGWYDADLAPSGIEEATQAGEVLKKEKFVFDVAHTSVLKRAVKTLNVILDKMDLDWIPVKKHWRLNERMYGDLQGKNKAETAEQHGEEQVKIWRRSYDTRPPPVKETSDHFPGKQDRYKMLDENLIPRHECLKDTVERTLPYWFDQIVPDIKAGKRVLVAAHGNSLRGLVKYLDQMSEAAIMETNIPTGTPLVYELDEHLKPIKHYYLGDQAAIKAAMDKVAAQGKKK